MENKWPKPHIYGKSGVFVSKQLQKKKHKQINAFKVFRISKQLCTLMNLQKEKSSHSVSFQKSPNICLYKISLLF